MSGPASHSPSVLERFGATHPDLEIWWDSSPLVFESWRAEMIQSADPEQREAMTEALARLWDPGQPALTEFRGATTNPPLSLAAMRQNPERWAAWIYAYQADHRGVDVQTVFWVVTANSGLFSQRELRSVTTDFQPTRSTPPDLASRSPAWTFSATAMNWGTTNAEVQVVDRKES